MTIRKPVLILAAAVFAFAACACANTQEPTAAEKQEPTRIEATGALDIEVLKIGKADAIIISTENHNVIIDCGEEDDGDEVVKYLNKNGITGIDYVFLTHFDKDHIGGFPEVAQSVSVENVVVPDYEGTNKEYTEYLKTVHDNNIALTVLREDMTVILDDCVFEINPPRTAVSGRDNDNSLVISVAHGENRLLFAGDAEEMRIGEILQKFKGEYDFLKVPHHGNYNASTKRLLTSLHPKYAVITDSDKNPADDRVVDILDDIGCQAYSTRNGDIHITSDGKEIDIIQ